MDVCWIIGIRKNFHCSKNWSQIPYKQYLICAVTACLSLTSNSIILSFQISHQVQMYFNEQCQESGFFFFGKICVIKAEHIWMFLEPKMSFIIIHCYVTFKTVQYMVSICYLPILLTVSFIPTNVRFVHTLTTISSEFNTEYWKAGHSCIHTKCKHLPK